jgi:hypothetical protein
MPSGLENLKNLVKQGSLKVEQPDPVEFAGLVTAGKKLLADAEIPALSVDGRFLLAYDAAHSLSLAALRWHGYRSEKRYTVFQVLAHTVSFPNAKWRFLDDCHGKRNLALYEGSHSDDEQLIKELIMVAKELVAAVDALGPVQR